MPRLEDDWDLAGYCHLCDRQAQVQVCGRWLCSWHADLDHEERRLRALEVAKAWVREEPKTVPEVSIPMHLLVRS